MNNASGNVPLVGELALRASGASLRGGSLTPRAARIFKRVMGPRMNDMAWRGWSHTGGDLAWVLRMGEPPRRLSKSFRSG
jgi:hypothetical protein